MARCCDAQMDFEQKLVLYSTLSPFYVQDRLLASLQPGATAPFAYTAWALCIQPVLLGRGGNLRGGNLREIAATELATCLAVAAPPGSSRRADLEAVAARERQSGFGRAANAAQQAAHLPAAQGRLLVALSQSCVEARSLLAVWVQVMRGLREDSPRLVEWISWSPAAWRSTFTTPGVSLMIRTTTTTTIPSRSSGSTR
jgi:hypothetical protein